MSKFSKNGNPRLYTLSAMIIGYLLIDNFDAYEQNALGNWFMTIGQILENNSAWLQVIQNNSNNVEKAYDIDTLKKTINLIRDKLKEL